MVLPIINIKMNSTRILQNKHPYRKISIEKDNDLFQPSLKSYPISDYELNDNPLSINFEKVFYETYDSPYNGFYKSYDNLEKPYEILQLKSDKPNDFKSNSIGKYIQQEQFFAEPQVKQEEQNEKYQIQGNFEIKQQRQFKNQTFTPQQKELQNDYSQLQYLHQSSSDKSGTIRKPCQTKNITKNFGKAIITFILKNKQFTKQFCKQFNIEEKSFLRKVKSFQGKVATIKGLRQFWLEQNNMFAKHLRIISMRYLRKHSLEHIFNSRIQNYSINIKYRAKMMQSLSNPRQFTSIKQV